MTAAIYSVHVFRIADIAVIALGGYVYGFIKVR